MEVTASPNDTSYLAERLRKAEERAAHLQDDMEMLLLAATEEEEEKQAAQAKARAADEKLRLSTELVATLRLENEKLWAAAGKSSKERGPTSHQSDHLSALVADLKKQLADQKAQMEQAEARHADQLKEAEAAHSKAVEDQRAAVEDCKESQAVIVTLRKELERLRSQLEQARRQETAPSQAAHVVADPLEGGGEAPGPAATDPSYLELQARFDAVASAHRLATAQLAQIEASLSRKQELLDEKTRRCAQLEAAVAEQAAQLSATRDQFAEATAAANEFRSSAYTAATASSRDKELLAAEVIRRENLETLVSTIRGQLDLIRSQLQAERNQRIQELENENGDVMDPKQVADKILARMETQGPGSTGKAARRAAYAAAEEHGMGIENLAAEIADKLKLAAPTAPMPYKAYQFENNLNGGQATKS